MRASLFLLILVLVGCRYEVRDPQTGQLFYTDKWVAADGYRGPLTFTDHGGRRVELRDAQVERLSSEDYAEALERESRQSENP